MSTGEWAEVYAARQPEFAVTGRRRRARTRRLLTGAGCLLAVAAGSTVGLVTLGAPAPVQRAGSAVGTPSPYAGSTLEATGVVTSVSPKLCIGRPQATGTCFRMVSDFQGDFHGSVHVGDCARVVFVPRPVSSQEADSGLALLADEAASCP